MLYSSSLQYNSCCRRGWFASVRVHPLESAAAAAAACDALCLAMLARVLGKEGTGMGVTQPRSRHVTAADRLYFKISPSLTSGICV